MNVNVKTRNQLIPDLPLLDLVLTFHEYYYSINRNK